MDSILKYLKMDMQWTMVIKLIRNEGDHSYMQCKEIHPAVPQDE
jgi:hypothetical protein